MKKITNRGNTVQKILIACVLCVVWSAAVFAQASSDIGNTAQQQQGITVTGRVLDTDGDPIPGVSVVVQGTAIGTATDSDGAFTLTVPGSQSILTFSYLGFTQKQTTVGSQREFTVTLEEDTQQISEVVVVGYGTQRRETLTGAVASINSSEILTTKTDNMLTNMAGKLPGLLIRQATGEPGDFNSLVSIRGYGSPVVVIDGIIRNRDGLSDLAQLNPDDIESISVLKDASAAIYGRNAANGVIIATTKRGEVGKTRVSYSGMYSMKVPTGMAEMMSAYEYRLFENEFRRNVRENHKYSDDIIQHFKNGDPGYEDWDWIDLCLVKMYDAQNHTVSVRGGNNRIRYFNSFSFNKDGSLYKTDMEWYKRWTLRSNLTADLTDNLTMNLGFSGRMDKFQRSTGPFIYDYKTFIVNDRGTGPYALNNPDHLTRIDPEDKNPMALIDPDIASDLYENLTITTQVDFTYKLPAIKGLEFNILGSIDFWNRNQSNRRNAWDMYSYLDDVFISTKGSDSFSKNVRLYQKTYGKFQINYSTKFSGGHSLSALVAVEASEARTDIVGAARQFSDLFTFPTIDAGTSTTATNSGSLSRERNAAYIARLNYDYKGKYLIEAMARYDGSYRYAPSRRWVLFPSVSVGWRVSEENFFKNNISFINNLKLRASYGESGRDQGAVQQYIAAYTSSNARGSIFTDGNLTAGMYPPGVVSDRMTWITAKFANVALDADLLKNKLGVTIEYFERRNTGILANRIIDVPNFFGASFPQENINSDLNRGLELQLKYRDRVGKNFRYSVGANVTFARTKRLHVERAPFNSQWDRWLNGEENRYTGRNRIYTYDGQYTSLTEYETAPLLGGSMGNSKMLPGSFRLIDVNGDGRINGDDQKFVNWAYGNQGYVSGEGGGQRVNPPLQFGFPIEFGYRHFDMNLLFQGAALYSVNYHMNDIWGYGRYPTLHTKFRDRWHVEPYTDAQGNITGYPDPFDPATTWIPGKYPAGRPYNYDNTTDGNAVDVWRPMASFLRMKNIELGYTVPKQALRSIGFENIRVFVNGTNLLLFCKKEIKQTDPERHENDWEAGLSYPIMKQVNLGVTLNF